jgi:quercetin dioxygenase-like cupin family protein
MDMDMKQLKQGELFYTDCNDLPWTPSSLAQGLSVRDVAVADGLELQFVRLEPGASIPRHTHELPEFIYVLEGELELAGQTLTPGWASVASIGSVHSDVRSTKGCVFLLVDKPV